MHILLQGLLLGGSLRWSTCQPFSGPTPQPLRAQRAEEARTRQVLDRLANASLRAEAKRTRQAAEGKRRQRWKARGGRRIPASEEEVEGLEEWLFGSPEAAGGEES